MQGFFGEAPVLHLFPHDGSRGVPEAGSDGIYDWSRVVGEEECNTVLQSDGSAWCTGGLRRSLEARRGIGLAVTRRGRTVHCVATRTEAVAAGEGMPTAIQMQQEQSTLRVDRRTNRSVKAKQLGSLHPSQRATKQKTVGLWKKRL